MKAKTEAARCRLPIAQTPAAGRYWSGFRHDGKSQDKPQLLQASRLPHHSQNIVALLFTRAATLTLGRILELHPTKLTFVGEGLT
jgi:hypothetical protein